LKSQKRIIEITKMKTRSR